MEKEKLMVWFILFLLAALLCLSIYLILFEGRYNTLAESYNSMADRCLLWK